MNVKNLGLCTSIAVCILLFSQSLFLLPALAQEPSWASAEPETSLVANFWVFLDDQYGILDLDTKLRVMVDISINFVSPPGVPQSITLGTPFSLQNITVLPSSGNYTYGFWGYPAVGVVSASFPMFTQNASIRLDGFLSGKSVFWRNTVEIQMWNVTSSLFGVTPYNLVLVPPSGARVLRVYSRFYPDLSYARATIKGYDCLVVSRIFGPLVVLYEPEAWQTYAFVATLSMIFLIYGVVFFLSRWRAIINRISKLATPLNRLVPNRMTATVKTLYRMTMKMDTSKLLTLYILFALLMVSLSFLAGPDPRLKVYVLSSTRENAAEISSFVNSELDSVTVTVFDEMSEFSLLTDLGVFEAVIVGDFYPPIRTLVETYIYPGLDVIRKIIVVKSDAFPEFIEELETRYAAKTTIADDISSIGSILRDLPKRTNAVGLRVSSQTYAYATAFVGLCSLFVFFLGLAFLSCKLIEAGRKPLASGLVDAVAFSVLVFVFTQVIYIACSVLLAIPLGLHASSPKVTALGFMGFGGATRPRMLAGLAGFLFGALLSLKDGLKLDKTGLLSFMAVVFFIVVDPLTSGLIFYEFMLLFTVGPELQTASTTMSYVKDFLAVSGVALGGWASPIYALSTGIILYFATVLPLCLFRKLQKGTATFLLLFASFGVADGGVRIANMTPWSTVASIFPGLVIGLFVCMIFYVINLLEIGLRTRLKI